MHKICLPKYFSITTDISIPENVLRLARSGRNSLSPFKVRHQITIDHAIDAPLMVD
jgi:hypothetical protein